MIDPLPDEVRHVLSDYGTAIGIIVGSLLLPALCFLFLHKSISRFIEGWFWHRKRNFELDEPIMVNDKECRLVRYDWSQTVFYEYEIDEVTGIVIFSDRWIVSNEHLNELKITRQIDNHRRPSKVEPVNPSTHKHKGVTL